MSSNDEIIRELRERLDAQEKRDAEILAALRTANGEAPAKTGNEFMNDVIRRGAGRTVAEPEAGEGDQ